MAQTIKRLCKANLCLINNIFLKNNLFNVGVRFLYTEKALGVTQYEKSRRMFYEQFASISQSFRSKMIEVCNGPDPTIFTEDLKAMAHLIENTDEDLELIDIMVQKYIESNREQQFTPYAFGPVMMRMYTYLKEPQRAYNSFNTFFETSFYHQVTSVEILFSLLYSHGMYEKIRELYDKIENSEKWCNMIFRCYTFIIVGCYKENTQESLDFASSKWKNLLNKSFKPNVKSMSLLSYLALNQNSPELALELVSMMGSQHLPSIRSLKCLACAHLKKYLNLIAQLKHSLNNNAGRPGQNYFNDVMVSVENFVQSNPADGSEEVLSLINALRSRNQLIEQKTLEEVLLRPFDNIRPNATNASGTTYKKRRFQDQIRDVNVQKSYMQRNF